MNDTEEILDELLEDTAERSEIADETAQTENHGDDAATEETELKDADVALEEERERYLRLYAEFDNFRKRTAKEKLEAYGEATARCIEQLLPVVDNFERAIDAPCSDQTYHSGMVMILSQLRTFLEKSGVSEIESLGMPFDPNVHNAIKQEEPSDEFPEGTICEVFQKGYMLKDRLIRPAMVAVAG